MNILEEFLDTAVLSNRNVLSTFSNITSGYGRKGSWATSLKVYGGWTVATAYRPFV